MTPFTTVTDIAVPFLRANVDTDVIIPIQRLVGTGREGLGPYAFERQRYLADGSDDPAFPLNRSEYKGSAILLAADNFGCGSSREGAVWALMGMGVRCVIAPSFGDIFFANCFQNGLLPVRLPMAMIRQTGCRNSLGGRHDNTKCNLACAFDLRLARGWNQRRAGRRANARSGDPQPAHGNLHGEGPFARHDEED